MSERDTGEGADSSEALNALRQEMRGFYAEIEATAAGIEAEVRQRKQPLKYNFSPMTAPSLPLSPELDRQAEAYPEATAYQLKALQYDVIAEGFQPRVFRNSPFYFEAGINGGWERTRHPGFWLLRRNIHFLRDGNPEGYDLFMARYRYGYGPLVDLMHHCPTFSNILEQGLSGIYARAEATLAQCETEEESDWVKSAMKGLLAARRVAERFAETAEGMLADANDEKQHRSLELLAKTAREVPWRKPETFYEGLNTLWFVREVQGLLEGLRTNSLGRPDAMLASLYEGDLAAGRLTKDEAYDLICQFLLAGDCHYDKNSQVVGNTAGTAGQELEITLTLGGCDENGNEVFNDITRMFLQAYRELKLIYPKPHCRFSRNSSPEYLEIINKEILAGHSVHCFLNDDCIIQALVKDGKTIEDARSYLCTGCWDIAVESREDNAVGTFSMAKILEASVHGLPEGTDTGKAKIAIETLDGAGSFEEVYRRLFGNIMTAAREMCLLKANIGKALVKVNPSPFYSACMSDCLENRRDFTAGGGRYNPTSLSMQFFANVVDTLLVIRKLCFETQRHSLAELLDAVRANWVGYDVLHAEVLAAPHFGDDNAESNALAQRLHEDICAHTCDLVNERGGRFTLAYWCYREFVYSGIRTKATPDGRRDGDYLAQSLNPTRLHHIGHITSTINSIAALDLTECPGDSVVNILLPVNGVNLETVDRFERTVAASNLQLLQLNCVNKDDLLDAREHPERHQDLIVRVCGFSARFVSLPPDLQDEFINRNIYGKTA